MITQFLGVWFLTFCLGLVLPVAFKRMDENLFFRTIILSAIVSAVLVFGKANYSQNLLIAGAVVCGAITLAGLDRGVKSLFGEILLLCILMITFVWSEYNAVFSGNVDYLLTKIQRLLNGQGFPFERADFGRFTIGGAIGVAIAFPMRMGLRSYLARRAEALSTLRAREELRNKVPLVVRLWRSVIEASSKNRRMRKARIAQVTGRNN